MFNEITTEVPAAAEALRTGMSHFVDRKSDVAPWVQQALEADPECAMAHAVQGLLLQIARHQGFRSELQTARDKARQFASRASELEGHYVAALDASVNGDLRRAVSHYESILAQRPDDLFALVLCQSELFWMGEMHWSENVSARVAPFWHSGEEGYAAYLAVRSFDLEESGDLAQAESVGKECVEIEPDNVWGAHAVAHSLLMQNRAQDGGVWLDGLSDNWQEANQLKFHLWWHRCLFYLELGDTTAVLNSYDRWVRNRDDPLMQAMPDLYIDIQNGASMLWRLDRLGVHVGNRWDEMAELTHKRLADMTSPFTSAHFAMILAAVGDFAAADKLLENMQEYTNSTDTLATAYAQSAIPAAQAAVAHRRGQHEAVVAALYPARRRLWQMGGSHAQQEVFSQILYDSACQCSRTDVASITLDDLSRRGFAEPHRRTAYQFISGADS